MKCNKAARLLPALVAGELEPVVSGKLARHLADCPACAALRAGFEADRALLRELPVSEPGPGLVTRVMAEARTGSRKRAWSLPALLGLRPGLAAAALVLLVAGGIWAGARLGTGLVREYADPARDPLAVNDSPSLTEYVELALGSGR